MFDMNFVLIVCALSFLLACGVSITISYFITKSRVAKNEDLFMKKIRQLDDSIHKLNGEMIACGKKTDELKMQCEALKDDSVKKSAKFENDISDINSEIESVVQKIEKINMKFADVNDRMNVLDSTINNLEHMRDFEIRGETSPYFFDEEEQNGADGIKSMVSGAQRIAKIVSDISIDTIAGTAFGIVNALKTHFRKG